MKKYIILFAIIALSIIDTASAQDPVLGEIKLVGFNFTQRGWLKCEGQLLPISQYSALFSLLGTTYGGDGRTSFGLPDLRGRVPVGVGQGPGLSNVSWGQRSGSELSTLIIANLPSHTHLAYGTTVDGTSATPAGNLPAGTKRLDPEYGTGTLTAMSNTMLGNTGSNIPVTNTQPSLVLNYMICTQGRFPSRN